MPKEVFTTNVVACRGRKLIFDEVAGTPRFESALPETVNALITTFRDGTRQICCPFGLPKDDNFANHMQCQATNAVDLGKQRHFSPCAFINPAQLLKKKDKKSTS